MLMTRLAPILAICAAMTAPVAAETVTVFAAASLRGALDRIAADFQAATGHEVVLSYAGSSALARQIIEGAPADLFLSASTQWMDAVEQAGLIVPDTRRDLLGNTLVLVAHGMAAPVALDATLDLVELLDGGHLAMALVDAVPAGQYGRAALETLGLWDAVAPMVAQADNVTAALTLVTTGEAPFGIVYATDVQGVEGVSVVWAFPADSHPPIIVPVALLTEAADPADRAFLEALGADAATEVFQRLGFTVTAAP